MEDIDGTILTIMRMDMDIIPNAVWPKLRLSIDVYYR